MNQITDRELRYCSLGNGLSVVDRNHMKDGDYERVAHITADRTVTFYVDLPPVLADNIRYTALFDNPSASSSQPEVKVFRDAGIDIDDFPDIFDGDGPLPDDLEELLNSVDAGSMESNEQIHELQGMFEEIGYTFDWDLGNEAHHHRKMQSASAGDTQTFEEILASYQPEKTISLSMQ